jgi:glucose/arabinose dehydrogenase
VNPRGQSANAAHCHAHSPKEQEMIRATKPLFALSTALACAVGLTLTHEVSAQAFKSIRVANGISSVLYVTHAPGDFERLFLVQQGSGSTANVRILDISVEPNALIPTPFATLTGLTTGGERGLLGMAFHPDYATNGYVYFSYTGAGGTSFITRYTRSAANPNVIDNSTALQIISQSQPFSNHNGGWIGFGPDGFLYYALGDGGSGNDPQNNGQNNNTLLGKMLRIDVNGDDFPADPNVNYAIPAKNPFFGATPGRDEIWATGLRNHWRNSFDRLTGDLWIGDVGQNNWEEFNYQKANDSSANPGDPGYQGGKNYGWRCMEGLVCTGLTGCTCNAATLTMPVWVYSHAAGNCSITGGYVYRGCAIPSLQGEYFFADYCSAKIWSVKYSGSGPITGVTDRTAQLAPGGGLSIASISSFGEDAYGEMYICDQGGEVFKIVPTAITPDCNTNGKVDACDLLDGTSLDANANGIPDECDPPACYADCDGSGALTIDDFICFQTNYALGDLAADCDASGQLNIDDFICFQTAFALGC